ncbi:enoyl-[acyl-carrier-protein] reductase FabV [Streptomyces sp. NPDC052101]|uniref:enoyl-[acyl-carrier-protein] reductase FabV n=1 Tax=Streptomyces sp. NPDC052101 TaxID=3155763 RepID=UPI00341FFB77
MNERVITPLHRGFLFLDAHPTGCRAAVEQMWKSVAAPRCSAHAARRPTVLVIGSSAGFGLAATIVALARHRAQGVGVCLEKAPARRTGTAGWYRTAATADLASQADLPFVFVNGDAFSDTVKQQTADVLNRRFGPVDHLIYSVAAPRRTDPDTNEVYTSAVRPIGRPHTTKTLAFDDGRPVITTVTTKAASPAEITQTVAVMGGADWQRWITTLAARGLLADGITTCALSYIGPPLIERIHRKGTIGAAKAHLQDTADAWNALLAARHGGRAFISLNSAAVTQSSTAIPGIALYLGLLRGVLGDAMASPTAQMVELWDQLTGRADLRTDPQGRIRLDHRELDQATQDTIAGRWHSATNDNIASLADLDWLTSEIHRLYGFDVPGVDYDTASDVDIPWPATAD